MNVTWCGNQSVSLTAGTGVNIHCSTPTVFVEEGPVGFSFTGNDGTVATALLATGNSLSVTVSTSTITDNAGTVVVVVGGRNVSLTPGQSVVVNKQTAHGCKGHHKHSFDDDDHEDQNYTDPGKHLQGDLNREDNDRRCDDDDDKESKKERHE